MVVSAPTKHRLVLRRNDTLISLACVAGARERVRRARESRHARERADTRAREQTRARESRHARERADTHDFFLA